MSRGYEVYIINSFRLCPIDEQVELIIETFPDSILFFSIDSDVGVDWPRYIKFIQEKYKDRILTGVLYSKLKTEDERRELEKYYLFEVGIQCGCIALESHSKKNFALIDRVMHANQACGRRKNVRAVCGGSCKANFDCQKSVVSGFVSDVSLSHFSFIPNPEKTYPEIPLYSRINGIFIRFNRIHFRTDATLVMKRSLPDGRELYIFLFLKPNGQPGLTDDLSSQVGKEIYKTVTDRVKKLLSEKIGEWKKNRENDSDASVSAWS